MFLSLKTSKDQLKNVPSFSGSSLHSKQPRKLHHVPLPSRFHQPVQLLIPSTQMNWHAVHSVQDLFCIRMIFNCGGTQAAGQLCNFIFWERTEASVKVHCWMWWRIFNFFYFFEEKGRKVNYQYLKFSLELMWFLKVIFVLFRFPIYTLFVFNSTFHTFVLTRKN